MDDVNVMTDGVLDCLADDNHNGHGNSPRFKWRVLRLCFILSCGKLQRPVGLGKRYVYQIAVDSKTELSANRLRNDA